MGGNGIYKWIPGRYRANGTSASSEDTGIEEVANNSEIEPTGPVQASSPTAGQSSPFSAQRVSSRDMTTVPESVEGDEAHESDEAAQAESGMRPSAPPSRLHSHPVGSSSPDGQASGEPSPREVKKSAGDASLSPATPARTLNHSNRSPDTNGSEIQSHLRKVTANLVDILDQMSNAGSSVSGKDPQKGVHHTIGSRGDSVATMVDLEAPSNNQTEEEMVPAHHVRRLTTTIVDMLRSMTPSVPGAAPGAGQRTNKDIEHNSQGIAPAAETSALLGDTASELSLDSDKLSVGTNRTAAESARDSEISAQTALLKAQYLPQPEYRGDEVRPFYMDRRGRTTPTPTSTVAPSEDGGELSGDRSEVAPVQEGGDTVDSYPIHKILKKKRRINWIGLFVFITFCVALPTYVGIRASKTLGLGGSLWYGAIVLSVEILGGLAMLPYGLCLTMRVEGEPPLQGSAADAAAKGQLPPTLMDYHIRVVIPCYKEPLEVISKTFMAAMYASMPPNCRRTVYLLDDGRDPDKRRFIRSMGLPNAVYISGRKRSKGEMNGKSANINNAMSQIYPASVPIPLDEVVCVFDADQVANADFFMKTVPKLDGGQDVAMVLSPQTFYNLNPNGDIFNHANVHFWDYTQPGYDALGLISCTGTNFLVRARAFSEAQWFPEWTLTEDFALGIELKRKGWQCCYVDEYLAVGEAPDEVRNCFQQRSRWAKGHFQVFFQRGRNPAFGSGARGLSPLMRWMYGSVVLSYFSAFLATPLLMLVPIITVWFGAFPIVINFWAAVAITIYYGSTLLLMYYTRSFSHLKSMWFASVANSVLWWAFLKAMYRATIGRWLSGTIVFKVTAKGLQRLNNLPIRDIWMSAVWFIFSLVTLIIGLVHFFKGGVLNTPLAISLIFMIYNLLPQYLLLQYASFRPRMFFNTVCRVAMILSTFLGIFGLVLIWILYPKSYDYKSALGSSLYFLDTQRVGALPPNFRVAWRHDAFLTESNCSVYLAQNPNATLSALGSVSAWNPLATSATGTQSSSSPNSFGASSANPFAGVANPFAGRRLAQTGNPFAGTPASTGGSTGATDPFAAAAGGSVPPTTVPPVPTPPTTSTTPTTTTSSSANPFGSSGTSSTAGSPTDPFAPASSVVASTAPSTTPPATGGSSPFAPATPATSVPTTGSNSANPFGSTGSSAGSTDPFAPAGSVGGGGGAAGNPFGGASSTDPFAAAGFGVLGPAAEQLQLATPGPWDLEGGYVSGMESGNMKATAPLAFTTSVLAWGFMSFPSAFENAGQTQHLMDSVRWGADYLSKIYKTVPGSNSSLLVTRIGDVETEILSWYRLEDGGSRPGYAVDLAAGIDAAGGDLGGGVAAALAASSILFKDSEDPADKTYAAGLLTKAKDIYQASKNAKLPYTYADYNMSILYNSTTVYDDLAWAAGWLYRATHETSYIDDMYHFYVTHLEKEGAISDWKYAFDWDNVFWPLNVLMAQETGGGTYKTESENFLRAWMCANNAVNYTQRGRAFNPMAGTLGATANTALLALMYSDVIAQEKPTAAQAYQCWALSQLRYVLGDAQRSLVVGVGSNPPTRTQDRDAGCPAPPAVCNRVTGLLSPDKDTYVIYGSLIQGAGDSDTLVDVRDEDSQRVGIENNVGFIGALAGASLLPGGLWEICLQQFGVIRSSPICGSYINV